MVLIFIKLALFVIYVSALLFEFDFVWCDQVGAEMSIDHRRYL